MEINGKIYRNLESQVGYLTDVCGDLQNQINDVRAHLTHYVIVDTLPTEDIDTSAVYLVGPLGTDPDTYYEEWVYVQLADESWSWEKLGDTDSVDLSGYLEKKTNATTYSQFYAKTADGSQDMYNFGIQRYGSMIPQRDTNGDIYVPDTPGLDICATSKKYVDNNFVAKSTSTTSYDRLYGAYYNGTQTMFNVSEGANAYTVAMRDSAGKVLTKDPVNSYDAVNKSYADSNYLAKDTTTSTYNKVYTKLADGSQAMVEMSDTARYNAVVRRTNQAQIVLPNQVDYVPTDDQAVSKRYVDAVVGQLLYLHDIELIITIDASNKLYVKAYLVSSSATAITSFDRQLYRRIDVQYGAFGADMNNAVAVAVTKLPDAFRQDEFNEPFIGFLYQYFSGGNLVSAYADSNISTTITDTVISF